MGQFEIPGFLTGQKNSESAETGSKLFADANLAAPVPNTCKIAPGFERVPTQLPGDRFNPSDCTAYASNSEIVKQYKAAKDSVVQIEASSIVPGPQGSTLRTPSTGSGFVATTDGRIVTGYHVVKDNVESGVGITMPDGKKYSAVVEKLDPKSELAVLRILRAPGETFKPLAMAESSDLKPGDRVSALGYPKGVHDLFLSVGGRWQSPTANETPGQFAQNKMFFTNDGAGFAPGGYRGKLTLQALMYDGNGRQRIDGGLLPGEDPNRAVISTDLKVESGNSGGPLLDRNWKAIGVIGLTDTRNSQAGSTPIEDVRRMLTEAKVYEIPNNAVISSRPNANQNGFDFLRPPEKFAPPSLQNRFDTSPPTTGVLKSRLMERLTPKR